MPQKNIRDAINETLKHEMRRDPTVVVLGEDVVGGLGGSSGIAEAAGGTFGVTAGLAAESASNGWTWMRPRSGKSMHGSNFWPNRKMPVIATIISPTTARPRSVTSSMKHLRVD
jgi:hypothetical protein